MGSTLLLLAGGELGSSSLQRLHKTAAISITEAKQDREAADSTRGQRWTAIGLSGFSTFDPEEMEGSQKKHCGKKNRRVWVVVLQKVDRDTCIGSEDVGVGVEANIQLTAVSRDVSRCCVVSDCRSEGGKQFSD